LVRDELERDRLRCGDERLEVIDEGKDRPGQEEVVVVVDGREDIGRVGSLDGLLT
jgi:hypothetical protein